MPRRGPNDCAVHAGRENSTNRQRLAPIMNELPKSQSGEGRAKCQYCAYERGYVDALNAVRGKIRELRNDA